MKKRLLSSIMTVLILAMSIPQFAFAASGTEVHTFDVTADAIVKGDDASVAFGTTTSTELKNNVMYSHAGAGSKRYMYYAFDISSLEVPDGHAVTSAKLKLSLSSSSSTLVSDMAFWYVDTSAAMWKEDNITFGTQPLSVATEGNDNIIKLPVNPDMMLDFNIDGNTYVQADCANTNPTSFGTYEFDIVPIVRKYLASGNTAEFSVAMSPIVTSGSAFTYVVTKERYDTIKLTAPTAIKTVLEITTEPLVPLAVTSTTPSDGDDGVSAADDIVINFNNPIDASSVAASDITITHDNGTVALTSSDITVSDTSIIVSKDLEKYTYYTLSITDVKDVYGQALSTPHSIIFETGAQGAASTDLITIAGNMAIDYVSSWTPARYRLNVASKDAEPDDEKADISVGGTIYWLVKLDISELDASKVLRDVKLSFTKKAAGAVRTDLYVVPNGDNNWTKASDFAGSSNPANTTAYAQRQESVGAYYDSIVAAINSAGEPFDTYTFSANTADTSYTTDITSIVNTACQKNEDYITICLCGSSSRTVYTKYGAHPPVVSAVQETPSFGVVSSTPSKHGAMSGVSEPIELNLATNIADSAAAEYIKLVKADGTPVPATVTASDNKIVVTPSNDLDAYSEYKVIFKSGLTDIYANTVSSDTVALVFNSGTPLSVAPIKFTTELSPVYDTLIPTASYSAGDSITVVSTVANSSSVSHGAIIVVGLYDAATHRRIDTEIVTGVVPSGGTPVQFSADLSVASAASGTYIKAFLWDGADTIRPLCSEATIMQD